MRVPITKKMLTDWAGAEVVRAAERMVEEGQVLSADYEPPKIAGSLVRGSRALKTALTMHEDGTVECHCPCYDCRERGVVCAHSIAAALVLVRRNTDPERDVRYREELRRASRLARIDEEAYIQRVPSDTPGALPARLRITLAGNWLAGFARGAVPLGCSVEAHGDVQPLDRVPRGLPLTFEKPDESLLFVLEDIAAGPPPAELELGRRDFLNVVDLLAGRALPVAGSEQAVTVNKAEMTTLLRLGLNEESGTLHVDAHTELPFLDGTERPVYLVSGRAGWVYGAGNLWPLANVLPEPYHGVYTAAVSIPRPDVLRFFRQEMPVLEQHARFETDLSLDLFTIEPGAPSFRLDVRGSPASLAATLYAAYDGIELVAARPDARGDFALPDPDDLLRYTVRNPAAEADALVALRETGFVGESGDDLASIVGERPVLNFLGTHLPALRRNGWRVNLAGRVASYFDDLDFVTPVVRIDEAGEGWFDVGFDFEDAGGASVSNAQIQEAIRKGESFLRAGGGAVLIDTGAVESMQDVFSDCAGRDGAAAGRFRMADMYAGYVKTSLDALDGVDVEAAPDWQQQAGRATRSMRIETVRLAEPLQSTLRDYQQAGVNWLHFLGTNGFSGILADEMGLGKTIQTLAWLQFEKDTQRDGSLPALIVCPTSLVENWAEEAARFVPELNVLILTGAERHERWDELPDADLAITSYALLRRDLDQLLQQQFFAAILDEAQHIKNRATQNAVAAKQIRARRRLVLTGTPVENSVADLWSIMDFLMPGYLGPHDAFRASTERPIARGGQEAVEAQARLRRKLQPFLLRRLKRDVARELPPKIEKLSPCDLTPDQRAVYREILESSRRKINTMVRQKGFHRCRMEILTTLMRLRQICCHLDLLKLPDLKARQPSGKMDLFFELLDEALDGGHRVLVFSQFVSMLKILRAEMEQRNIATCYLDGSTQDRLQVVHRFNTQRDIPAFLISLKAGGTGLNLTGADMVIHFDPWWNPAVENQATDRAYRIGQTRTVYNVKLITRGTVEEKVLELQKRKKAVIDATVESDEAAMQALSWADVQEILAL